MKKRMIKIFLAIFSPILLYSQTEDNLGRRDFEFILRGKVLGFVIVEDDWARSFSAGCEIRYKEQFSITMDAVHFQWRHEEEIPPTYLVEPNEWDPRNYAAFEFRYYPRLAFVEQGTRLYLTCFAKFGTRKVYREANYPMTEGSMNRLHSDFHDIGPAVGIQLGDVWGLDINMGGAYRQEVKSEEIFHENAPFTYTYNVWERRWIYNIRVNFFFAFRQ